jgi:hypothetical protein
MVENIKEIASRIVEDRKGNQDGEDLESYSVGLRSERVLVGVFA